MKYIAVWALLLSLTFAGIPAGAQDLLAYLAEVDRKYGSDVDLVNGEKYFYPYTQAEGDPFLYRGTQQALIRIREREFADQRLKYDVYNQQLVLEYKDLYGGYNSLVLRAEWVEGFSFGSRHFKKMVGPDGEPAYLQVIYEGAISCYYFWTKQYQMNLNSGIQNYYFTDPVLTPYLVVDGAFIPYRNNTTFLKAFGKEHRKDIKQVLRQSKARVRRTDDAAMKQIMEYCNALVNDAD
jgi:hypothetical protein